MFSNDMTYGDFKDLARRTASDKVLRGKAFNIHCAKNHIFFFQMFWKDGLSKRIGLEYDLSCVIRKDDISYSRKYHLIL